MAYSLLFGDCLESLSQIPDNVVDLVLVDLPYGITKIEWDKPIDLGRLWRVYDRICKTDCVYCFFATMPFVCDLLNSRREWFRYDWIWDKRLCTGFANAKRRPMRAHEHILVFCAESPCYFPQMVARNEKELKRLSRVAAYSEFNQICPSLVSQSPTRQGNAEKHPSSVIRIGGVHGNSQEKNFHPTQKPVELGRYLIRTYTLPGQIVLDNAMGTGAFGVAAVSDGRVFIGCEKQGEFFDLAKKRIGDANNA